MALTDIVKKALEGFQVTTNTNTNTNTNTESPPSTPQLFVLTVVFMLWFLITVLVGKYLWNECLCKVLTICKPTDDLFVIFGIILLFDILHPNF